MTIEISEKDRIYDIIRENKYKFIYGKTPEKRI